MCRLQTIRGSQSKQDVQTIISDLSSLLRSSIINSKLGHVRVDRLACKRVNPLGSLPRHYGSEDGRTGKIPRGKVVENWGSMPPPLRQALPMS